MKVYIVASNTSRTAIVIAGSKKEAEKIAKHKRKMDNAEAYEINEYFKEQIEWNEITGEAEIWDWLEEKENE